MSVLSRPDQVFEAAFFESEEGDRIWVDLSDYVELQEGLTVGPRRQTVFDDVAASVLTLSLNNSDGTFNTDRDDNPFYGKVGLDVPVRYRLRWPNVPATTRNMLSDVQSLGSDSNAFTVEQGTIGNDLSGLYDDFEEGLEDWWVYPYPGLTITWATDWASSGTHSARLTSDDGDISDPSICKTVYVNPGETWNVTATFYSPQGYSGVRITADFFDSDGDYMSSYTPSTFTLVAGVENTQSSGNFTIPAGTLFMNICLQMSGTPSTSIQLFVDDVEASQVGDSATSMLWDTGVLEQTGIGILTGNGPTYCPGDKPVYVEPGQTYSARVKVRCDSAGTGIGFHASLRMRWFDIEGSQISETSGSSTALSTSDTSLTVSGTSPATAASVRIGVFNETVVRPVTRTINFIDSYGEYRYLDHIYTKIPASVSAGNIAFMWLRVANKNVTVTEIPDGWANWLGHEDNLSYTRVYYKVLEPTDIGRRFLWRTSANVKMLSLLTCYEGVNPSSPVNGQEKNTESVFQASHVTPNLTTTENNCMIVSAVFDTATATGIWSAPGGESVRAIGYGSGGNAPAGIVTDDNTVHSIGTYGNKTFTSNVSSRYATKHTIALAPASGTGPGSVQLQLSSWELVEGSLGTWEQGGHWESKFTGYTDSWSASFRGDLPLTVVRATDRQKHLATRNVESAIYEDIQALNPIAYYKLDETGSTTTPEAANSADTPQSPLQPVTFGTGTGAGGATPLGWGEGIGPGVDSTAALLIRSADSINGQALVSLLSNPLSGVTSFTLIQWFNSVMADTTMTHTAIQIADAVSGLAKRGFGEIRGYGGASGYLSADASILSDTSSRSVSATSNANYFDGETHMLAGTFALTGGQLVAKLYVDGELKATDTTTTRITEFPVLRSLGVGCAITTSHILNGTFAHSAVIGYEVDADTLADIYTAGHTAFSGDTATQRISRICSWKGLYDLDLEPSDTIMDRHMPDSQTFLDSLRQVARSEGGVLYINGDDYIAFKSRTTKELTSSPWITVPAYFVDNSLEKTYDDTLFVNKANVKRLSTQTTETIQDDESVDIHSTYEKTVETILDSSDATKRYAEYIMAFYSDPKPRYDPVRIDAMLLQDWEAVIRLDIWQMLRITNMPATEAESVLDLYAEGWEMNVDDEHWYITFDTSQAIPFAILNDTERNVCGSVVVGW